MAALNGLDLASLTIDLDNLKKNNYSKKFIFVRTSILKFTQLKRKDKSVLWFMKILIFLSSILYTSVDIIVLEYLLRYVL